MKYPPKLQKVKVWNKSHMTMSSLCAVWPQAFSSSFPLTAFLPMGLSGVNSEGATPHNASSPLNATVGIDLWLSTSNTRPQRDVSTATMLRLQSVELPAVCGSFHACRSPARLLSSLRLCMVFSWAPWGRAAAPGRYLDCCRKPAGAEANLRAGILVNLCCLILLDFSFQFSILLLFTH